MKLAMLVTILVASVLPARAATECPAASSKSKDGVLVAWVTDVRETTQSDQNGDMKTTVVGPFRPLAMIRAGRISEAPGASLKKGQRFWRAIAPSDKPVSLSALGSFVDHMGEDHCVHYGNIKPEMPQWTLLTSQPATGMFRAATKAEQESFRKFKPECTVQGDYPDTDKPPCSYAEVLAVSDLNKDGQPELWATELYMWDTGVTVWQPGSSGDYSSLLQICPGCSD